MVYICAKDLLRSSRELRFVLCARKAMLIIIFCLRKKLYFDVLHHSEKSVVPAAVDEL